MVKAGNPHCVIHPIHANRLNNDANVVEVFTKDGFGMGCSLGWCFGGQTVLVTADVEAATVTPGHRAAQIATPEIASQAPPPPHPLPPRAQHGLHPGPASVASGLGYFGGWRRGQL